MGITCVLFFYAVVLSIGGAVAAAVLGFGTFKFIPRPGIGRRRAVIIAILFPFACIGYAGVWFASYAIINDQMFHRDPGLGDSWYTPLPNGYALLMIDTTDQGTVYNPKTQPVSGGVMGRDDAVFGVRQLQVAGNRIFGARDSGYFGRIGQDSTSVDAWFELDTKGNRHMEYSSLSQLREQAAAQGVQLNLRSFYDVFSQYRTTWFDFLAGALLLLGPLCAFSLLARWIWRIRQKNLSLETG